MQDNIFDFNNNNENFEPATERQIAAIKHMGYQGNIVGLTKVEASQIIEQLKAEKEQQQAQAQPEQPKTTTAFKEKKKTMQNTNQNLPLQQQNKKGCEIVTRNDTTITVTKETVSQYLGVDLTDPEFSYFFSVCKNYKLNPFLKEIYAIKFGSEPATFVIDYKVLQQAVDSQPQYDGLETGVLYIDKDGNEKERKGAYILPNETLVGAWCIVHRKDRSHTNKVYALYDENVKISNKTGKPNSNWGGKPVFMITKVAKAQAIRETFPNMFDVNVYTDAEFDGTTPNEDYKANSIGDVQVSQNEQGNKDLEVDFDE